MLENEIPKPCSVNVPYSGYPLWRLKEWKTAAEKAGDSDFVRVCETAIAFKEAVSSQKLIT